MVGRLWNERIKELANIAANRNIRTSPAVASDMADWAVIEKFAELIVRECCQAFETEVDTWKQMDPYQGGMKRAGTKAIKQHFGVEE